MVLIDTSVWIDHLRVSDERLLGLLETGSVLVHPFVVEEISCGHLKERSRIIRYLRRLPAAPIATHSEVLDVIEIYKLYGVGLGGVDVHLIASAMLAHSHVWTRDKSFAREARRLRLHID